MYTEFDYDSQVSAGQAPNPRSVQEFNLRQAAANKFNAAKARLAGSPKIQAAAGAAKGAYGSASKYLGPAGVVLSAGMEAKDRLDRGEDGQRAATGAVANATGALAGGLQGAAMGSFAGPLGTIAGGIIGGIAGGAAAGYATDRVTDAVRGNDGKGADGVLKDFAGRIESARAGGNFAQAAKLTQEAMQFQSKAIGQGRPGYAEARGMGIAEGDVDAFGELKSKSQMSKHFAEQAFVDDLNRYGRVADQEFGQTVRTNEENMRIAEIERQRAAQVARTQNASRVQGAIQQEAPLIAANKLTAMLNGVYTNAGMGIR